MQIKKQRILINHSERVKSCRIIYFIKKFNEDKKRIPYKWYFKHDLKEDKKEDIQLSLFN